MNNFFNTLRKFFAPPVFEGDEEKTRAAELMNTVLNSIIVLSTLASIALILAHAPLGQAIGSLSVIPFMLIFQIGMRRGYVRAVSILTVSFLIINMSILMPINGTVRTTSITLYMLASIIAGLTLGRQAAYWTTGVNSLIVLGVALAEMNGLLPPVARDTALQQGLIFAVMSIMTVILLNQALRRLQIAFDQLTELNVGLEQRVADRTKDLSTVAEVSTTTSTILETQKLLQEVVDLTKERFNFYHAHIYLLNETGDTLMLSSGAGNVGQQMVAKGHAIPLDREQSLVARAAREKKGVTVNDVTQTPDFLPNPLLPDTHSEMAVPMIVGEQVIGVFDVQSEQVGRFAEENVAIQTTLAAQVASAVQNARTYSEVQHSQEQLAEALSISRLANWEYDLDQDIFTFNDNFYSIFRTSVEKVGGYKLSSADYARLFVHPEDAPLVGAEIQRVVESKERHFSTALEHRIIFSDGEVGYISVRINVERDENGKIIRWYGANQDITERRRLEELNRKRAVQQEAINLITQRIQSATTIEDAMQVAARELGHALGQRQTLVALEPSLLSNNSTSAKPELK